MQLATRLNDRSLAGFAVGITADRRWEEQAQLFARWGAQVVHGPTIRTLPYEPDVVLRRVTESLILDPPDVLIANTGIGMRAWFVSAESWGMGDALVGALTGARRYARGPKAAAILHQMGLDVAERAPTERLCDVVALATAHGVAGRRVALQRHGEETPIETARLSSAGASVVEVPVYRWAPPDDVRPALRIVDAVAERRVHAVTFTSAPAVRGFFRVADDHGLGDTVRARLEDDVLAACVGPVCAGAARDEGVVHPLVPDRARIGPLVRAVAEHLVAHAAREIDLAGVRTVLQGTVACVDGRAIELSDREASVLAVLADRAGAVVSKAEILAQVWGPAVTDPHVVEVTVARLRRRLEAARDGIVSVPRRGYRLEAFTTPSVTTARRSGR